ncbi:MAG: DUF4159 domain-containing protein [Gemmatimonadetes bacterium]|nr:DUF4159 domain-containing protein [Gemmatimonadota bacterium]MYB69406.1 DUF4159 domain-containing protein [Gemmatimonadota bacterium]
MPPPQSSHRRQSTSQPAVLPYDPSDGWEDSSVHSDPESKRLDALKMGANIAVWALSR